ncbi:hypothetical protein [Paraburkholderia franconis]|uniref:hypothetical protein n=1 Tax=Paraburkholderia franconis TaxID=2654983 RepID=UPI003898E1DD
MIEQRVFASFIERAKRAIGGEPNALAIRSVVLATPSFETHALPGLVIQQRIRLEKLLSIL